MRAKCAFRHCSSTAVRVPTTPLCMLCLFAELISHDHYEPSSGLQVWQLCFSLCSTGCASSGMGALRLSRSNRCCCSRSLLPHNFYRVCGEMQHCSKQVVLQLVWTRHGLWYHHICVNTADCHAMRQESCHAAEMLHAKAADREDGCSYGIQSPLLWLLRTRHCRLAASSTKSLCCGSADHTRDGQQCSLHQPFVAKSWVFHYLNTWVAWSPESFSATPTGAEP